MRTFLTTLVLVTLTAACGGAPDETSVAADQPDAAATTLDDPTEVDDTAAEGGTAEPDPARIVSLSPTATEVLFAIGAGDQVVAVDEQSDHPEGVPVTDLSGYQPNVEAIAGYDPDLVVTSGDPADLVASLEALDIEVLLHPSARTLDEAYDQILETGHATGHVDGAEDLVSRMQDDIDAIVAGVEAPDEPLTYYHELDPTYYSVTSSTFIGEIYGLLGLTSIADAAEDDNGGYPQLSPEHIVEADPDIIFLADGECCDVDAEQVAARPGWETMTAVGNGAIVSLDEDVASRWGPRVVDFLRTLADEVAALQPAT